MGRRAGRGPALTPDLAGTLLAVSRLLSETQGRWWIIGSAAVALHGEEVDARDVDVLLSIDDADRVARRLAIRPLPRDADPRFRSDRFLRWMGAAMPVEFMAGFCVYAQGGWQPVVLETRQAITVDGATLFVPDRQELRALLLTFGRTKDRHRAAQL